MNNPFNKKDYYEIQKIKRINYKDKEYLLEVFTDLVYMQQEEEEEEIINKASSLL